MPFYLSKGGLKSIATMGVRKELRYKLLPLRMLAMENAIFEFTEVVRLSTGSLVGLTMRGDGATDALSALQIGSRHKQTRYSYNTKPNFTRQIPALEYIHV